MSRDAHPAADPQVVIHDLIAFPPLHDTDLAVRTRGCSREALVAALEDAIEDLGDVEADDGEAREEESALIELLGRLAPDHAWLVAVDPAPSSDAGDDAPPAAAAAAQAARKAQLARLRTLPAEYEASLVERVAELVAHPSDGAALADALLELPEALQVPLLGRLERARVRFGTPAPLLYEPLLAKTLPAALKAAVDATLASDQARPRLVEGFAWLSSCDGVGGVTLFAGLRNPDTSHTVLHVAYSVFGGIEGVIVFARQTKKAIEKLMEEVRVDGIDFVRAPIELAARLVADAAERGHRAGQKLAEVDEQALALLAPVKLAARPSGGAPLVIAMPPEPVEALFRRGEYASWFLDAGDLLDAGVELPRADHVADEWVEAALPKLDREPLRARLTAMASYMGLWHELRRETQLAALLRAQAWPATLSFRGDALTEHGEASSPCSSAPTHELFFGVVARSFFLVRAQLEPVALAGELGDPELRHGLKESLFAAVRAPHGEELARLDVAEYALLLIEDSLHLVAPARRPKGEALERLAERVAGAVIALRGAGKLVSRRTVDGPPPPELVAALQPEGGTLHASDATVLASALQRGLVEEFFGQVCNDCPIDCWRDLKQDAAAPFFATAHPAAEVIEALAGESEEDESEDGDESR